MEQLLGTDSLDGGQTIVLHYSGADRVILYELRLTHSAARELAFYLKAFLPE